MRAAPFAAALVLLAGCAFPSLYVKKSAAVDFGCPEEEIVVHELSSGYLARGCRKEANYFVRNSQAIRDSGIRAATVDERPELPIDHPRGSSIVFPDAR